MVWLEKPADFIHGTAALVFINSIVRANKSQVNDRRIGLGVGYFVNNSTIVAESEYNRINEFLLQNPCECLDPSVSPQDRLFQGWKKERI